MNALSLGILSKIHRCPFGLTPLCKAAGTLLGESALHRKGFDVRRSVCYKLEEHRDDVEPFIPGDFAAYVSYMATEGVWGGKTRFSLSGRCHFGCMHGYLPLLRHKNGYSGMYGIGKEGQELC